MTTITRSLWLAYWRLRSPVASGNPDTHQLGNSRLPPTMFCTFQLYGLTLTLPMGVVTRTLGQSQPSSLRAPVASGNPDTHQLGNSRLPPTMFCTFQLYGLTLTLPMGVVTRTLGQSQPSIFLDVCDSALAYASRPNSARAITAAWRRAILSAAVSKVELAAMP
ncbi:hypothetical protein COO60DRAFT_1489167, partial [Scenedesmus sp. NREL 46B-D3]